MPKLGRRSEFSGLDYGYPTTITIRDAPFGTNLTPTFKPRIVGSHLVNYIDRPIDNGTELKYDKGFFVSDKPNNMDPQSVIDFNQKYNKPYQAPFQIQSGPNANPYISRRPDSKDISCRYPKLAPIDSNRIKNHGISTVFEPEPWTRSYHGKSRIEKGKSNTYEEPIRNNSNRYTENGLPRSPLNSYEVKSYQQVPSTSSSVETTDEEFRSRLLTLIPKGSFLPDRSIDLTNKEISRLKGIVSHEMSQTDPLRLRDVYLDITNSADKALTGYCLYQDLYHALSKSLVTLPPDLLQLVAAMFVSDFRNQKDVNYEKFLSFLGSALKLKNSYTPSNSTSQSQFFNNSPSPHRHRKTGDRPGSPYFTDGGEGKLLRMIEQQLNENDYDIDLERLNNLFQIEDREMRGTLSAEQIKAVCAKTRIPLQESLINSILSRCSDGNRDRQFSWRKFVEFLERVQPTHTGLPIPVSKRPLEYARQVPTPNPNWPKAQSQGGRPYNPGEVLSNRREEVDPNREMLSRMDQELKIMEKDYEELKKSTPRKGVDESSWFKSFMQFADALYMQDDHFQGNLPYQEVQDWTKMHNENLRLGIPDSAITKALSLTTRAGKVNIHEYLTLLSKQH